MPKSLVVGVALAVFPVGVALIFVYHNSVPGAACIVLSIFIFGFALFWMPGDDRPRIVPEFDGPKLKFNAKAHWVGERPIIFRNAGRSPALDVCLNRISLQCGAATQKTPVAIIDAGGRAPVVPDITGAVAGVSAFEVLLQQAWSSDGHGMARVPVRIVYRDERRRKLYTSAVIQYSLDGTVVSNLKFGRCPF